MLKKKFFAKALAFAMVMGTVGVHGMAAAPVGIVKAADQVTITVNPATYEATITVESTKSGYVCLKVLKENSKDAKVVSEAWYPVDSNKKAVVDLSFLKATKEQYIMAVDMSGNESAPVTIAAQPKTVIKYDAKTQKFVDKSKVEIADLSAYEYKTLYGSNWGTIGSSNAFTASSLATFKTDKLENAIVAGTTLIIRKAAVTTAGSETPAGTEVKVKIPAVAKAPKVKVDYVKGSITLPKNVEIVLVDDTNGKLKTGTDSKTAWVKTEGKLTPDKLLTTLGVAEASITNTKAKGYSFAIRTAEVKDKKAASNMTFIKINPAPMLDATTSKLIKASLLKSDGTTVESKDAISYDYTKDGLKLTPKPDMPSFSYSIDGKKWTPITGEVTVKVEDKAKVQIYVPAVKGDDSHDAAFASNVVEVTYEKPAE